MKKKIIICLFVIITLLSIGCVKKKGETKKNNTSNTSQKIKENQLIINGYDLTLSEPGSFEKLSFKYPNNTTVSSLITTMTLIHNKKGSDQPLFKVGMFTMYGTSLDKAMEGFTKTGEKTYNGVTWSIYSKDGNYSYAMNSEYDVYVIGFIYDDDALQQFEEEFMKTVTLKK